MGSFSFAGGAPLGTKESVAAALDSGHSAPGASTHVTATPLGCTSRQHLDELIADLDRRVARLEAELAALLSTSAWAASLACLTSAPGIGLVTAAWLLVGTRNFTLCVGPEALAAYAGLAPVPRESGRSVRGRPAIGHDGNARLRTAL